MSGRLYTFRELRVLVWARNTCWTLGYLGALLTFVAWLCHLAGVL